ncbi:MAG: diguanylate cyclase [bacterium]|nr:diguanylate cyclase [bacterium]
MGFLDKLRNFGTQIKRIEDTVYNGKQSLLEVYELNAKLELEIAQRTKDLDIANKQMLTLQHIWEMMNSSEPLSSVLIAITNSLKGELGYKHSCIVKNFNDGDESYSQIIAYSGSMFEMTFKEIFKSMPSEIKLHLPKIEELYEENPEIEIYQTTKVIDLIKKSLPTEVSDFDPNSITSKSYLILPLKSNHSDFGYLIVFSKREHATENELKFLNLFSKQIELAITIADLFQAVREQAVTDSMTGLYNRRYFEEFMQKEAVRANRQNLKFTVIGIDLDHLKEINDTYGHNYGDIAIKAVSDVLKNSCRNIDIAARMGGEEFNVILPGVDSNGGLVFAERIRKNINKLELEKIGHITASIGVGTYSEHSEDIDELLELVDRAMYESKRNGRNRVSLAKAISEISWQEIAIETFIDILSKHRVPLDDKTSRLLNKKIKETNLDRELIYQVSDELVSTYNPENSKGKSKKKVLLATLLAKRFELSKDNVDKLKIAMLLYDIGNTMLPKDLLNKTDPLNDEELAYIKQHPLIAAREILKPITCITDIIPIIEKHHENWNGSGYPMHISGDSIPIESQIILIVDSYFALTENRPYRNALSKDNALNIIKNDAGTKWSLALAEEFISVINNEDIND